MLILGWLGIKPYYLNFLWPQQSSEAGSSGSSESVAQRLPFKQCSWQLAWFLTTLSCHTFLNSDAALPLSVDPGLSSGFALILFFLGSLLSAPGHSYPLVLSLSFPYLPEVWLWLNLAFHANLFPSDAITPTASVHQFWLSFAILSCLSFVPLVLDTLLDFQCDEESRKMARVPFWIWIMILKH